MKITIAQLNFHVGNFSYNLELMKGAVDQARADGADLVLFSELAVTGYPPHDLLEHRGFIEQCNKSIAMLAGISHGITIIAGAPSLNTGTSGKKLFNSAVVVTNGKILATINKSLLPTYDIFDEYRYFEPSRNFKLVEIAGRKVAVTICEDLWDEQGFDNEFSTNRMYNISPMEELSKLGPDLVVNLSASPFSATRGEMKRKIFTGKAAKYRLPVFMCNQVGGNTELIFDGSSMAISPDGSLFDMLPGFEPAIRTYDLEEVIGGRPWMEPVTERIGDIYSALVLGTRDYFSKMKFEAATLGLSGGIDSAVCLAILADALGPERVRVLLLPSMYSSQHSVDDAVKLAGNLGVSYDIINISEPYYSIINSLKPLFGKMAEDVTEENIQARVRALLLMALSNKFGNILVNTSNKSEAAVGYGTLYGDMAGGISLIGDIYKTDVYRLAEYINRNSEIIPVNSIEKPPSAELRPGQVDADSLPDYDILDSIIFQYIELQKPATEIKGKGISPELINRVIRLININEYKRFQAPPVLRISSKAFGYGRRMPLVARYDVI